MTSHFKINKNRWLAFMLFVFVSSVFSQSDTNRIKAEFALGMNNPSQNGFVDNFEARTINFPTINLGVQYMFDEKLGVKLDLGYNRLSNLEDTPFFKVNYTRLNAQLVVRANNFFGIRRERIGVFVHIGPGLSLINPLGNYPENTTSFLNTDAGIEFHYGISKTLSAYIDASYILGFSKDFNPVSSGFGSFNGNIAAITAGISISLSGCYFCERR